jgi:hypothetical protein
MSLCEIPTNDPKNPALIDAAVVTFIIPATLPDNAVYICERGGAAGRLIETKLTTREVGALLEAASEPTEKAPDVLRSGLCTVREAELIAGLRRMADPGDVLEGFSIIGLAQSVLRDAGVADAEPEQGAESCH